MTGQDAVNAASAFDGQLGITGVMLTKLDGDARGGAALSVTAVTGKPIKFAGVGEKLDQIEPFHPDRMAGRILGMGDVLTLIEKAEQAMDEKKAAEMAERLKQNRFTLTDYYEQLTQLKGMGSMEDIAGMMGLSPKALKGAKVDEKGHGPHGGHHPLDDAEGAGKPQHPRQLAQKAHRRRQRHLRHGGQPPAQAVRHDAPACEADERRGRQKMKRLAKMGGIPGMPGGFPRPGIKSGHRGKPRFPYTQ